MTEKKNRTFPITTKNKKCALNSEINHFYFYSTWCFSSCIFLLSPFLSGMGVDLFELRSELWKYLTVKQLLSLFHPTLNSCGLICKNRIAKCHGAVALYIIKSYLSNYCLRIHHSHFYSFRENSGLCRIFHSRVLFN
jgi:hypothetical protein